MLTSEIKRKALQLGYLACGVIPANAFDEYTKHLDTRTQSFPESESLYEPFYAFAHPPEGAKSVIVCTRRYNGYHMPKSLGGLIGKLYLFHCMLPYSEAARAAAEFEAYLQFRNIRTLTYDTPVRLAASIAGLGTYGYNNFFYDSKHGSYVWIDTWVVDKTLEYDATQEKVVLSACSEACQKCIKACPTRALAEPFSMNRGRCLTHLLTHAEDTLDETTRGQMGRWLYGCDICQDICPMNKGKFEETEEFPLLAEYASYLTPERILEMDENTFDNVFRPRFFAAGTGSLWQWKCNVLRSLVNAGDTRYYVLIQQYTAHPDPRVREIAEWGCQRLGISDASASRVSSTARGT